MALRRTFWLDLLSTLVCFLLLGSIFTKPAVAEEPPAIAAAADLQFALEEIARLFAEQTGQHVQLTFGSSGNFARQIEQGAPFQIYLSADEAYVSRLADKGLTRDRGEVYAIGRVVIFAPHDSSLNVDGNLSGLHEALAEGRIQRFAIANPEHAPYGRAAREALKSRGLWEAVRPFLVLGENVAQAAQFATTGNSQGGIIAYSLALSPVMRRLGRWALLPETDHEPLRQRMVLLVNAGGTATRFFAFMQQPAARSIMGRYGFVLPGD